MVVIFAIILVVFFVNGAKNGSRIGQVYSNSLQENAANEDTNEIDANNTNNVEYVSLNNGLDQGNSVDMPINADNAKKFDKSYIGKYTWKDGDNSISFELSEENGETKTYRNLDILSGLHTSNGGKLASLYLSGNDNIIDFSPVSSLMWSDKSGF